MKRARPAFALIELVVALALLLVIGGAIHDGLRRQQRVFRSIALMVAARGDVRDAAEVLATDLLSASPLDTLPLASDSAVEFFSAIGVSISCDSAPQYEIRIPPEKLASGLALTSLLVTPDSNDLLLVYNDDSVATGGQPRWDRHAIASVSSQAAGSACPSSTGFTTAADAAAPAYVITLRGPADAAIRRGAPVRIVRRTRYSLYRSSDSRWYLGQRRCNPFGPSACATVQPLSGPYAGYSQAGYSGVGFRYFTAAGGSPSTGTAGMSAARVDLAIRGRSITSIYLGRTVPGGFIDSVSTAVAFRNRD